MGLLVEGRLGAARISATAGGGTDVRWSPLAPTSTASSSAWGLSPSEMIGIGGIGSMTSGSGSGSGSGAQQARASWADVTSEDASSSDPGDEASPGGDAEFGRLW